MWRCLSALCLCTHFVYNWDVSCLHCGRSRAVLFTITQACSPVQLSVGGEETVTGWPLCANTEDHSSVAWCGSPAVRAQTHQTNIEEHAAPKAACCFALHCLCLSEKAALEHHRRTTANSHLACMSYTCIRGNDFPYHQDCRYTNCCYDNAAFAVSHH